ncbi:MAG: FeoA family protein [Phycisphaerales bacterium]|nr:FeoA family protein [Phycisphaerales bacterium]
MTITTLDTLDLGATATIANASGDEAALLRAMGLREGAEIRVRRVEPCIVEAGHARVGLSAVLTPSIEVAVSA